MPSYAATGIVIGRTNFGEADRIIRLFTVEHGKVSVVAKGVRRLKSRSAGHLEPLGIVKLMLATGRGSLDVVTSANLQWYPHELIKNYQRLDRAFQLVRILDQLTEPGQSHPTAFAALHTLLKEVDSAASTDLVEAWYILQLLNVLGYRPELGQCLICGYDEPNRGFRFDAVRGGLVCQHCADAGLPAIDIPAIKLWRLMCDFPFEKIRLLQNSAALATTTVPLAEAFLKYHAIT